MAELRVLRLFGNPFEFLPEILPLHKLRHLSLANIRIVADELLRSVNVQIEVLDDATILAAFQQNFCTFSSKDKTVKDIAFWVVVADGEQFLFHCI